MQLKNIFILAVAVIFSINSNSDELIGSMGCEKAPGTDAWHKQNVFIFLYGTQGKYSKICKDNIGDSSFKPMTCYGTKIDAVRITSDDSAPYYISLQRKNLRLTLYKDAVYQCKKSADPQSVENYVKNAKQNQLNQNQF